jgi:hypothetical protein
MYMCAGCEAHVKHIGVRGERAQYDTFLCK